MDNVIEVNSEYLNTDYLLSFLTHMYDVLFFIDQPIRQTFRTFIFSESCPFTLTARSIRLNDSLEVNIFP